MDDGASERRILDGSAWRDFCRALERAGDVVLRPRSPHDAFDRAEGFRYLTRLTRVALESFLEFADPRFPVLRRPAHETVKIGADNPDNYYQSAAVSGACEYRLTGTRGTVHYLGFGTYAGGYGSARRRGQTGYLDARQLAIGPDGRFEIAVACERRPDPWLPMAPDTSLLIVRQTFRDRARERIAELAIERVGGERAPEPISAPFVDRGLQAAAAYVAGTAALFADWAEGFAARPNQLPRFDPAVAAAAHGDPNIAYYHGYWELAPDQALVVEVVPPRCDYWNFQVNNHWMESLDYRYHRIALNGREAVRRADGSVRLVVAHAHPGVPNWLETAGHARGTMCLRWVGAESHPDPATRVATLAALRAEAGG
jgi:hypothetical protein